MPPDGYIILHVPIHVLADFVPRTKNLKELSPSELRVANAVRDRLTTRLVTEDAFPSFLELSNWIEYDFEEAIEQLEESGKDMSGGPSLIIAKQL